MLGNAVCAAFVCVLGYYSIPLIRQTINSLTPRLKLPYALNYIVVLLSAVLMLIYFIALIVKDAKELRTIPKGAKNDLNESLESSMEAEMGDNVHIDGVEEEDK